MPFVFKRLALLLSIAAAFAADKDAAAFKVRPIGDYPSKQSNEGVTIAAKPYINEADAKSAFGKNSPYQSGILPVLIVIQNNTKQAIRVDQLKAEYVSPSKDRVEATPARDVKFTRGPDRPPVMSGPTGKPKILKGKKNPLDTWEIEGRSFAAKMIPPGETASGFLYFHTGFQNESTLYLSGINEAGSGKELFYFEIPLQDK